MTYLKLNGLMHVEDEYNQRTSLSFESASLKFVIYNNLKSAHK